MRKLTLAAIVASSLVFVPGIIADDDEYEYKRGCKSNKSCEYKSKSQSCGSSSENKREYCGSKQSGKSCGSYKSSKSCGGKYKGSHKSKFLLASIYELDLTKEQKAKIDGYMKNFEVNRAKIFDAFTQEGFDKEKYIKARMDRRENMIKAKADLLEKVYSVLTKEQKENLKDFYEKGKGNKSCKW